MQFFDMSKYDAIKALDIYKRAGQQVVVSISSQSIIYIKIFLEKINAQLDCFLKSHLG